MSEHLFLLFLFQSGLAFAFSWFIARVLLGGAGTGEPGRAARESLLRGIAKARTRVAVTALVLPPVLFGVYYKSLPEGQPYTLALWPAGWILMLLAAVALALTLAVRGADKGNPGA